jgi:hypothetical protein
MNSPRIHHMSEAGGNVIFFSGSATQGRLAGLQRLLTGEVAK